jgi:sirohydrochlorin ferrochelatase
MATILLVDNGSKRAAATLQLRKLANALADRLMQPVYPVSLQHADAIDDAELAGEPALMFTDFVDRQLQQGKREFVVLPLFFGNSRALTSFIPQQTEQLTASHGPFDLHIAETLYPLPHGDPKLAEILYDHVIETIEVTDREISHVVLVEHGSPLPEVNQVRRDVADLLQGMLQAKDNYVLEQAVMERRKGEQYDFNGDMLEHWLINKAEQGIYHVVVAMLFVLPGRHAGEGGDIVTICEDVMRQYPQMHIAITPLVSEHDRLVDMLEARLRAIHF